MATGRVPTTANSPLTAKGDLFTYDTSQARLAVGNNGETLVADSSASVGLRYQEPKAGNPVINSAFQVWQRGTSFTPSANVATYTADRWQFISGATGRTISRQTTSDSTNLPNIQYCARIARDSGNTSTSALQFAQSFESVNSIPFAGKTVTLSFYARAGANFSASSSQITVNIFTGTGTDQNIYGGYTGSATPVNSTATLTTTWQRFSYTATLSSTAAELAIYLLATPVGTAGANDWFEVTGVQLEVGSVATPFKTQGVTLAGELAACQRYYWRSSGNQSLGNYAVGSASSTTNVNFYVQFPVTMRTVPTALDYSNLGATDEVNAILGATSLVGNTNQASVSGANIAMGCSSGATQYRFYFLINNTNTAGYLGFSAEL